MDQPSIRSMSGDLPELGDQPVHRRLELVLVSHVEIVPYADAQPGLAVLVHHADEPLLALLQPDVLGQDALQVGEVAPEVVGREDPDRVAALDDRPLHLRDDRRPQAEVEVVDEDLEPSALSRGTSVLRTQVLSGSCWR